VRPGENVAAVVVRTSQAPLPRVPGKVIAAETFDPEYSRLLDELVEVAREADVEPAPDADAVVGRAFGDAARAFIPPLLDGLRTDPRKALQQRLFLELVLAGALQSPHFDLDKVRHLLDLAGHRRDVLGDERVEVSLLTPAEWRAARPRLLSE
jgi:hypothetical protein